MFGTTEEDWRYASCERCRALVLVNRPAPAAMGPYYRGYYPEPFLARLERRTQGGKRAFGAGRVRALGYLRGLRRVGFGDPTGKRLLDVGAGLGSFTRYARDLGRLQVRGVARLEADAREAIALSGSRPVYTATVLTEAASAVTGDVAARLWDLVAQVTSLDA
jgi:2-polyprenyl-3-methyl-5-hydroxy-6-metoxy-1,4-benzoquinol methylase